VASGKGGPAGKSPGPRAGPRSVTRGLDTLRLIASGGGGALGLAAIAASLRLPKTSVLGVLRSLQAGGYVTVTEAGYGLSGEALALAASIGATVSFPGSLLSSLRELAAATGETVTLGVHSDDGLSFSYVEVIESGYDLRTSYARGGLEPIHGSPCGEALLAFMPEPLLQRALRGGRRGELLTRLAAIRAEGAASETGARGDGAMGVGAAVFERGGRLRCAVAADGPAARIRARRHELVGLVKRSAEKMSNILGYHGEYPAPRPGLAKG